MGQNIFSDLEKNDSVKNDGEKAQSRNGAELSNQQFNEDFRKAATSVAATLTEFALPSSKDLLQQLGFGDAKNDGGKVLGQLNGKDNPLNNVKPAGNNDGSGIWEAVKDGMKNADSSVKEGRRIAESIGEVAVEVIKQHVKEGEARQHKIAEQAAKDKDVQKVTEKHDGPIATVIIEKKDGSVVTHKPDGTKITELDGMKTTEYPKELDPKVAKVIEYPNGGVEKQNRDGSFEFTPKDGNRVEFHKDGSQTEHYKDGSSIQRRKPDGSYTITAADGTKTTRQKDGTEIVEKTNGDRTVTKPEKTEADGTKVWHKNDGTEVRESKNGTRTTIYPESVNDKIEKVVKHPNGDMEQVSRDGTYLKLGHDGSMKVRSNDGNTTTIHANGDMETHSEKTGTTIKIKHDGTVVTSKKDGTVKTIHPNGTTESENSQGDKTIKTPNGDLIKIKHDGSVTHRNPAKLKEAGQELSKVAKNAQNVYDFAKFMVGQ